MKQRTAAPNMSTVAYARACDALGTVIDGAVIFATGGSQTATNLSTRRLGMRPT